MILFNRCLKSTFLIFFLSSCSTWGTGRVDSSLNAKSPTNPATIQIFSDDIQRPYVILGDVSGEVNKMTVFHSDPSREQINEKLREAAAQLGADAIIFARYGKVGVSIWSWGTLEGSGRAIKYNK